MSTFGRIPAGLRQSVTVAALCAGLMLNPLAASVSFADTNSAIDKLLGEAITQAQTMVALMTNNCSGGAHGQPPEAYDAFVKRSNDVNKQLVELRVALARGETPNATQQIDSAKDGLEKMVTMMHENCSGGAHGVNPGNYGKLVSVKENVSGKLDAVKTILEG
ncbi:hypothetical protein [Rhizobium leguminosarum]|uniref:hypothetical protein n=1 Tax=Rhizobium leguminosarum TaxID=384 RepID=UPI003F9D031A